MIKYDHVTIFVITVGCTYMKVEVMCMVYSKKLFVRYHKGYGSLTVTDKL